MRIGIDLGGSKIEAILLDHDGTECSRIRMPTPSGDYPGTIAAICALVGQLDRFAANIPLGPTAPVPVGVGIPGAISPASGLVKNANSICLIGRDLHRDLTHALARPVKLANDANCFAVSEATDGAAAGAKVVFGVILGTGVGGGICLNGHALSGANAIAGEWGHNPLPWPCPSVTPRQTSELPGPPCYCGQTGCIETFLSGPGLCRDHVSASGENLSSHEIVARADQGHRSCQDTLQRYEHRLARALASVINILDPDVIVLGGGLSNLQRLYTHVPQLWGSWVFSDTVSTRLVQNHHGDSSGVRGAAWLWGA